MVAYLTSLQIFLLEADDSIHTLMMLIYSE
jgi:hypothetical protein